MACGDLVTTTVTSPPLIKFLFVGLAWIPRTFGGLLCKLNLYLVLVALLGCIFSLTGIQIDRFLAVIRPLTHSPWRKWTKVIIPAIWLAAILLPIRHMWHETGVNSYSSSGLNISVCTEEQVPLSIKITLSICFLLPSQWCSCFIQSSSIICGKGRSQENRTLCNNRGQIVWLGKSPKWWLLLYFLSLSVGHRNLFLSGCILSLESWQPLYPGYFHLFFGYKCLTLPWILFSMRSLTNLSDLASRKLYLVVFYGNATGKSCKVLGIRIRFKT